MKKSLYIIVFIFTWWFLECVSSPFGAKVLAVTRCITEKERVEDPSLDPFKNHSSLLGTGNTSFSPTTKPLDANRPNLCGLIGGSCPPSISDSYTYSVREGESRVGWGTTQAVALTVSAGQTVYVPPSGRTIGSGMQVLVSHIDVANGTVSLQYTLDAGFSDGSGNAVNRYDLIVTGLNINSNIISAYNSASSGNLVALPAGFVLGTALGSNSVKISMLDTGTPMDLLEGNDFWKEPVAINPLDGTPIYLEYKKCFDATVPIIGGACKPPIYYTAAPCCQKAAGVTDLSKDRNIIQQWLGSLFGLINGYYAHVALKGFENPVTSQSTTSGERYSSVETPVASIFYDVGSDYNFFDPCYMYKNCVDTDTGKKIPIMLKLLSPDIIQKYPSLATPSSWVKSSQQTVNFQILLQYSQREEVISMVALLKGYEDMGLSIEYPPLGSCDSGGCFKVSKVTVDADSGRAQVTTNGNACWPSGCSGTFTVITGGGHDKGQSGSYFAYQGSDPTKSQKLKGMGNYRGVLPVGIRSDPNNISSHMAFDVQFEPCSGADCYSNSMANVAQPVVSYKDEYIRAQAPNVDIAIKSYAFLVNNLWSNPEKLIDSSTPQDLPQQDFFASGPLEKKEKEIASRKAEWNKYYNEDDTKTLAFARANNLMHGDSLAELAKVKKTQLITDSQNSSIPTHKFQVETIANTNPDTNSACQSPLNVPEEPACSPDTYEQDAVLLRFKRNEVSCSKDANGVETCNGETDPKEFNIDTVGILGGYNGCTRDDPSGFTSADCNDIANKTVEADTGGNPSLTGLAGSVALGLWNTPKEGSLDVGSDNPFFREKPVEKDISLTMEQRNPLIEFGTDATAASGTFYPRASIIQCSSWQLTGLGTKPKEEVDPLSTDEVDRLSKAFYDKAEDIKQRCVTDDKKFLYNFGPYKNSL